MTLLSNKSYPFALVVLVPSLLVLLLSSFSKNPNPSYKLVVFEGSDWCANCIRFEENVLSDPLFKVFLEKEDIQVERIDFPQRKKQDKATKTYNAQVADQLGFQGIFPTLVLVDLQNNTHQEIHYKNQNGAEFKVLIRSQLTNFN